MNVLDAPAPFVQTEWMLALRSLSGSALLGLALVACGPDAAKPPASAGVCKDTPAATPACVRGRTIVLVRHAEKGAEGGKDPSLSDKGKARAKIIAGMLAGSGATRLVATPYKRTQETLAPLAEKLSLKVESEAPEKTKDLLKAAPDGAVTVIATHSNILPPLVKELANGAKLRGVDGDLLAEEDFGRVVIITQPCQGAASVVELSSSIEAEAPRAAVVPEAPRYPTAPDDTEAVVLQRTACNGQCPMYSVGLASNGNVHFYGEKFTKKLGYSFTTIPRENVAALNKFIDAHPAAPGKHPAAPDRAGAFVVLHRKGTMKKVEATGAVLDEIDRVAGTKAWVESDQPSSDGVEAVPAAAVQAMLGRQLEALDKCAKAKTEISMTFAITELGAAQMSSSAGKKEADSDCIKKAVGAFRFPLTSAPVAPLTLTIGK